MATGRRAEKDEKEEKKKDRKVGMNGRSASIEWVGLTNCEPEPRRVEEDKKEVSREPE